MARRISESEKKWLLEWAMLQTQMGEFQEAITKEAIALMIATGPEVDTGFFEESVAIIGRLWTTSDRETLRLLGLIEEERRLLEENTGRHVYPEEELPMNATGLETLENIWELFGTAVFLGNTGERLALYKMAKLLAETQNLKDWIIKAPKEQDMEAIKD